jgi:hypothetical protein
MKAKLEFNLPDDQMELNRANQSLDMACALFDILQLRKKMERCFDDDEGNAYDGIAIMAKGISDILEEHNINIDKLIE